MHITQGMQLLWINQTKVTDMCFDEINKIYSEAVNSPKPMKLGLLEGRAGMFYGSELNCCPDVTEAME